jgi:hypothetical protein
MMNVEFRVMSIQVEFVIVSCLRTKFKPVLGLLT